MGDRRAGRHGRSGGAWFASPRQDLSGSGADRPVSIRPARPDEGERLVAIWAGAVDATHDFLTPSDRRAIGEEVAGFLPGAPTIVAVDQRDRPIGFMLIVDGHMEALFVDPGLHGAGIGRALVAHALADHPRLTVDVNEQNDAARRFYTRAGFVETGRSPLDGQGRPYPILHLRHDGGG